MDIAFSVPSSLLETNHPKNKLDTRQVPRAVKALLAFDKRRQTSSENDEEKSSKKIALFDDDEYISLQFALKRVPKSSRNKPVRIPLAHTLYGRPGQDVVLITKDPQREYEQKLKQSPVANISQIVSLERLRTEFHQFKDRKALLASADLFLADDRVLPLLPALLGKIFFSRSKQPAVVNIRSKNFAKDLNAAIDSTFFIQSPGASFQVKIGTTGFSAQQLVDNINRSICDIVANIPKRWNNVQAIHLKSASSVALPLYNSAPVEDALFSVPEPSKPANKHTSNKNSKKSSKKQRASSSRKRSARQQSKSVAGEKPAPTPPVKKPKQVASKKKSKQSKKPQMKRTR